VRADHEHALVPGRARQRIDQRPNATGADRGQRLAPRDSGSAKPERQESHPRARHCRKSSRPWGSRVSAGSIGLLIAGTPG
jgi:hypothetical protein